MPKRGRGRRKKTAPDKRGRGRPRKFPSVNLVPKMEYISDEEVSYSNDHLPEFFKLYKPEACSETMKIPPAFIDKFGGNIPTICTLERASADEVSWLVAMKRENDHWFFQKGWPEFVQENSLQDGDFLTFAYAGNSTFYVKVYSENGCTKRAEDTSRISDDESSEYVQETESSESDYEEEYKENIETIRRGPRPKSSMATNSLRRNPSFSFVFTEAYIRKGIVRIPMDFWKSYMRKHKGDSIMVTLWVNDDEWTVSLTTAGGRIRFTKGCARFVRENSIKIGTLSTFHLIDADDLAFEVTIHR